MGSNPTVVKFGIYFAKTKKDQLTAESAVVAWVLRKHNSTRVGEGRKSQNLLAIKMKGTNRSGKWGKRAGYVTPDLSYD